MNRDQVLERQAQWDRFHEWEREARPRLFDLDMAWAWYEDAWVIARQLGSIPAEPRIDPEKLHMFALVRSRMAHLPWSR